KSSAPTRAISAISAPSSLLNQLEPRYCLPVVMNCVGLSGKGSAKAPILTVMPPRFTAPGAIEQKIDARAFGALQHKGRNRLVAQRHRIDPPRRKFLQPLEHGAVAAPAEDARRAHGERQHHRADAERAGDAVDGDPASRADPAAPEPRKRGAEI